MKVEIPEKVDRIDVVRRKGDEVHVLGRSQRSKGDGQFYYHLVHDIHTGEVIDDYSFYSPSSDDWRNLLLPFFSDCRKKYSRVEKYEEHCQIYIADNEGELIKNIRVYQGSIDEVSKDLGRKLKRVDMRSANTFIFTGWEGTWSLRLKAWELGADAVVNYQSGSGVGTPVKFVD